MVKSGHVDAEEQIIAAPLHHRAGGYASDDIP
jgi:hypothetical protein